MAPRIQNINLGVDTGARLRGIQQSQGMTNAFQQGASIASGLTNNFLNAAIAVKQNFGPVAQKREQAEIARLEAQAALNNAQAAKLGQAANPLQAKIAQADLELQQAELNEKLGQKKFNLDLQKKTNSGDIEGAASLYLTKEGQDRIFGDESESQSFQVWYTENASKLDPTSPESARLNTIFQKATATKEQKKVFGQLSSLWSTANSDPEVRADLNRLGMTSQTGLGSVKLEGFAGEGIFTANGQAVSQKTHQLISQYQGLNGSASQLTAKTSGSSFNGLNVQQLNQQAKQELAKLKGGSNSSTAAPATQAKIERDRVLQNLSKQELPEVSKTQERGLIEEQKVREKMLSASADLDAAITPLNQYIGYIDQQRSVDPDFDANTGGGLLDRARRGLDSLGLTEGGVEIKENVIEPLDAAQSKLQQAITQLVGVGAANSEKEQEVMRQSIPGTNKSEQFNRNAFSLLKAKKTGMDERTFLSDHMEKYFGNVEGLSTDLKNYWKENPTFELNKNNEVVEPQDRQNIIDWHMENNPDKYQIRPGSKVRNGEVYPPELDAPEYSVKESPNAPQGLSTPSEDADISSKLELGDLTPTSRENIASFQSEPTAPLLQQVAYIQQKDGIGLDTAAAEAELISELDQKDTRAANKADIPSFSDTASPELLRSIANTESAGGKNVISSAGAKGSFQFIDSTGKHYWEKLGFEGEYNPFDNEKGYRMAKAYMNDLLTVFDGNTAFALAAYNGGPKHVSQAIKKAESAGESTDWDSVKIYLKDMKSEANYKQNTQYVDKVLGRRQHFDAPVQLAGTSVRAPLETPVDASIATIPEEERESFLETAGSIVSDIIPDGVEDSLNTFTNALTLGGFDEAMEFLTNKAGLEGSAKRDAYNKARSKFQKENPKSALALDVAGGVSAVAGGAAALTTRGVTLAAPSALGAIGASAAAGAGRGFLEGDGGAGDRTRVNGAIIGGAAGAVLPPALRGLGSLAKSTGRAVSTGLGLNRGGATANRTAFKEIVEDFKSADIKAPKLQEALDELKSARSNNQPLSAAAALDTPTVNQEVKFLGNLSPQSATRGNQLITKKFGEDSSEQLGRIGGILDEVSPASTQFKQAEKFTSKVDEIIGAEKDFRTAHASKNYKEAFTAKPTVESPVIEEALTSDLGQEILSSKVFKTKALRELPDNSTQKLDIVRRLWKDEAQKARRAGDNTLAKFMDDELDDFTTALYKEAPELQKAVSDFAADSGVINSLNKSQVKLLQSVRDGEKSPQAFLDNLFKNSPEEIGQLQSALGEESFDGFKAGLRNQLQKTLDRVDITENRDIAKKLSGTTKNQNLIKEILGKEEGEALIGALKIESKIAKEAKSINQVSPTANFSRRALEDLVGSIEGTNVKTGLIRGIIQAVKSKLPTNHALHKRKIELLLDNDEGIELLEKAIPELESLFKAEAAKVRNNAVGTSTLVGQIDS